MPIYEYVCTACDHRTDILLGLNDPGPNFCPSCGREGTMRKQFAPPTIHFKGSGWAKKDRGASSSGTKASKAAGDGGKDGKGAGEGASSGTSAGGSSDAPGSSGGSSSSGSSGSSSSGSSGSSSSGSSD
jgi:putative FmdB family regulatory protein